MHSRRSHPGWLRHSGVRARVYWELPRPEPIQLPDGGGYYPTTVAHYAPAGRHPEGRVAQKLDIVQGTIDYADAGPTPFIGQVMRVNAEAGTAEIALIKRSPAKAKRLPFYQLQNLAAEACDRVFLPLRELQLRSRASRAIAPALKSQLG